MITAGGKEAAIECKFAGITVSVSHAILCYYDYGLVGRGVYRRERWA